MSLTASRLREVLNYDPDTGIFTWKTSMGRRLPVGQVAGGLTSNGYVAINIDKRQYKAHRLAWLYVHGRWPTNLIDHRDTNKQNNAIGNLRDASNAINMQNQTKPQRRNKAGLLGVAPHGKKWGAKLKVGAKKVWLGVYETPELAHAAYVAAKRQHHPGNTL